MVNHTIWRKTTNLRTGLLAVAGVMMTTQASAIITVKSPGACERLEPGETIEVELNIDSNSAPHTDYLEIRFSPDPTGPWHLLRKNVTDFEQDGKQVKLMLEVPQVVCSSCRLQFENYPGRGDYDDTGSVRLAIGTDCGLSEPAEDPGPFVPGGPYELDPKDKSNYEGSKKGTSAQTSDPDPPPSSRPDTSNKGDGDVSSESGGGDDGGCSMKPGPASGGSRGALALASALFAFALMKRRRRDAVV